MPFEYGDWVDWWVDDLGNDPLEMIASHDFTNFDKYIEDVPLNTVITEAPIRHEGSAGGDGNYLRDFGGGFPQEEHGLDELWRGKVQCGFDSTGLWPSMTTVDGHTDGSRRGAGYELIADGHSTLPGNGVHATNFIVAYSIKPSQYFYDSWVGPFFAASGVSPDPGVLSQYFAWLEATSPGDEWFPVLETNWPIFVDWQLACDEYHEDVPVYSEPPSGEIFVSADATGFAAHLDPEEDDGVGWGTPGGFEGSIFTTYLGGAGPWLDVPPEWQPGQSPTTGQLIDGDIPIIVLNCYINGWQAKTGDGLTFFPTDDTVPNGFGLHFKAERKFLAFAVKMRWKPPRVRWGREIQEGVVRQFPRDDAQGWGSGTRFYPPTKANRTVGGIQ